MTIPSTNQTQSTTTTSAENSLSGRTVVERNFKENIFDFVFNAGERRILDADKDGHVELSELNDYVKSAKNSGNNVSILNKLGKILNVNCDDINTQKNQISHVLVYGLSYCDEFGNKDDMLSLSEIEKFNYRYKTSNSLNFGIIDGDMSLNKQGSVGNCWLLSETYNIMLADPKKYNKIVKQDLKTGDVTVTFYGVTDEDGNPFKTTIKYADLLAKDFNNDSDEGSIDADSIAMEIAMNRYIEGENNKVQEKRQYLQEYIKSLELTEKPSIARLRASLQENERLYESDFEIPELYLKYSQPNNDEALKIKKELQLAFENNNCTPELLDKYDVYLKNSEWDLSNFKIPKSVSELTPELNNNLRYFLYHAGDGNCGYLENLWKIEGFENSKGLHELDLPYPSGLNGQKLGFASELILGGEPGTHTSLSSKYNTYLESNESNDILPEEKATKLKVFTKEIKAEISDLLDDIKENGINGNIYQVAFSASDKVVISKHAYTITGVEGKYVRLYNSHGEIVRYPVKLFKSNFSEVYKKKICLFKSNSTSKIKNSRIFKKTR